MTLHIGQGACRIVSTEGVRAPHLFRLRDGGLLLTFHVDPDMHFPRRAALRSVDAGRTWQPDRPRVYKEMAWGQDGAGTVLAFERDTFELRPGTYLGACCRSADGGRTFQGPSESTLAIDRVASQDYPLSPEHYPEEGHVQRKFFGPIPDFYAPLVAKASARRGFLFWRYLLFENGQWLGAMQGRFNGDVAQRSILVSSRDNGLTWQFVSTIGYEHDRSIDGLCEPALCRVADGSLLCVMRRHGPARKSMVQCRSLDGGRTWSEPEPLIAHGVDPDLCLMSNGVLACTFGRPGLHIMFSEDGCGYSWGYRTTLGDWRTSGTAGTAEVRPGELLVAYDRVAGQEPEAVRTAASTHIGTLTVTVGR